MLLQQFAEIHLGIQPRVRSHWHEYESGSGVQVIVNEFACIPVAAIHINMSSVWVQGVSAQILFLGILCE